jgi:poly-gamma-glutamate capsule biosynthesis protein CapA/YwtB (metallophosphatase superfamily)
MNINNIERKSKPFKPPYLLLLILSGLGVFLFFYLTNRIDTVSAVNFIFSSKKRGITYETYNIYLDNLGEVFSTTIRENLGKVSFEEKKRFDFVDSKDDADIVLTFNTEGETVYSTYLLPVGHIYWVEDSISSVDIKSGKYKVLLDNEIQSEYLVLLQNSFPNMRIEKSDNLIKDLEDEDCGCTGLVEPDQLSKEYKLLKVDDKYFLDTFDSGIEISLTVNVLNEQVNSQFISNIVRKNIGLEQSQLNTDTVVKVNMTGVTALGRRVAQAMDLRNNYDYPAEKISGFLSDADITHTSNEVSFVPGCSAYSGMRFCAPPESIETLKAIGLDIVELTGNHNNDFGSEHNTQTIERYKEEGIEYFGGGLNTEDASKAYITEVDGTKLAFLGYNYFDSIVSRNSTPLAGTNKAGANAYSESKMKQDIISLRDTVDIVIVDIQFQECYSYPSSDVIYPKCYKPIINQKDVFRKAVDFGADIVVGTQAHQPQTYELYKDGIIFYGLGNLFFDQSMWIGTRHGIVLTHYFVDGELIQTKITPTIYDSSLQTQIANNDDAELLLELLKTARNSL